MEALLQHLPKALHAPMLDSRYFVQRSKCIQIASDSKRDQSKNEEDCHQKLLQEIKSIYKASIPGVTSVEQKEHVKKL